MWNTPMSKRSVPDGRMGERSWGNVPLWDGEDGQGTVEYVLVMLAAAAVALALLAWVNETSLLGRFFNAVMQRVIGLV